MRVTASEVRVVIEISEKITESQYQSAEICGIAEGKFENRIESKGLEGGDGGIESRS